MAQADLEIESGQIRQESASAAAARSAAREAAIVQDYTRIASPASGVVTARPVAPGTLVQPGAPILRIAEIDRVRVQANVAVSDLDGIAAGAPVTIAASGMMPIHARVTAVFPAADADTRTAVVETVIPNPGHRLLPGAFVSLTIAKPGAPSSLMVPAEAVVHEDGQAYVWIAQQSGSAPMRYRATGCGQIYSAADAKKYRYICPMDHSKLLPVAGKPTPSGSRTAHRIPVREGGSDGAWTEAASSEMEPGDQVVRHGQAGLVEGAVLAATPWGPDGPQRLPSAAQATVGVRYRCEKCGMTYSAADAKKNGYIDPMDGGKLVAE
jgi:multidrug efflux pump subunit AcrA (membrane-fusion protein)